MLEKPYEYENRGFPILCKKLFLVGKSGVGKTSTVDKLAGRGQWVVNACKLPVPRPIRKVKSTKL